MDEKTKRTKIKKYFNAFPVEAIWLILIGAVIAVVSIGAMSEASQAAIGIPIGAVMVLAGIGWIAATAGGRASDREMDQWRDADLLRIRDRARHRLGVTMDECIGEEYTVGPGLLVSGMDRVTNANIPTAHVAPRAARVGRDGLLRVGCFDVAIFFPTEKFLGSYSCVWDFCDGEVYGERTEEFFYQDVVSVTTKTGDFAVELPDPTDKKGKKFIRKKVTDFEVFRLSVSSGDAFTVSISSEMVERALKAKRGSSMKDGYEKAVNAIRKLLREKK